MTLQDELMHASLGIGPKTAEGAILRLLVEVGVRSVGGHEGSLLVYDPERRDLTFAMTYGNEASESVLLGQRVPVGEGITGLAAQSGEVQIGAPVYTDVQQSETIGPIQSVLAAPMMLDDRLVGVITAISSRREKQFSIEDARLYGGVATVAALIVDQSLRLRLQEGGDGAMPGAFGPRDAASREVIERIGRILTMSPQTIWQVARTLEAIEAIAQPSAHP